MRKERTERASLYSEVTNRIIAELEEGRLPWVQPWDNAACGWPRRGHDQAAPLDRRAGLVGHLGGNRWSFVRIIPGADRRRSFELAGSRVLSALRLMLAAQSVVGRH